MNLIFALIILSSTVFMIGANRDSVSLDSLCIFNNKDQACWIDKQKDKKKTTEQMDKMFCVDEIDFRKITTRLQTQDQKD